MRRSFLAIVALSLLVACSKKEKAPEFTAEEARAIAKEAYLYGFPLVDNYRVQYSYFVDAANPEYKGDWNDVHNESRVYTPEDKAIQSPNSDTPYSAVGADLRAEPLVITVPEVDEGRYYTIQFIDMYTHNFAYVGSRATGNGAGDYLLAGPDWQGQKPDNVKDVIRCETQLALLLYRTQLFNPADIENVKKIQDGYRVHTLSQFLGQPAPAAAPEISFMKPLSRDEQKTSLGFYNLLNFVLQFCPTVPSEADLMARFARIDVGAGKNFDPEKMRPDIIQAISEGMKDAWAEFEKVEAQILAGTLHSGDLAGTREHLKNNYAYRMAAAVLGIYGNSKEEAVYPLYKLDSAGAALDGMRKYTMRFAKDQLPPVNAFWSVTLYELPQSLLYDNALDRYLINSPMVPKLDKEKDGSIILYIQHASPGPKHQSNWLPSPAGPFMLAMRLYWPKPEALDGTWTAPPLERVEE